MLGNDTKIPIDNFGSSSFNVDDCMLSLTEILHNLEEATNLLLVSKICNDGKFFVEFYYDGFCVKIFIPNRSSYKAPLKVVCTSYMVILIQIKVI